MTTPMDESSTHDEKPRVWIAIRKDIAMSPGKLAAQVGHALFKLALVSAGQAKDDAVAFDNLKRHIDEGGAKIAVVCDSKEHLLEICAFAETVGIPWTFVQDAGHTEVSPGTLTVCAFGPTKRSDLPSPLKRLRLYKDLDAS